LSEGGETAAVVGGVSGSIGDVWREAVRRHRVLTRKDRMVTYTFLFVAVACAVSMVQLVRNFFEGEAPAWFDFAVGTVVFLIEAGLLSFSIFIVWVGHFRRSGIEGGDS
jgi:hypothetical protein